MYVCTGTERALKATPQESRNNITPFVSIKMKTKGSSANALDWVSSEASGTGGWQDGSDHNSQVNAAYSQRAGTEQQARERTRAMTVNVCAVK